jgi:hypothetical protein
MLKDASGELSRFLKIIWVVVRLLPIKTSMRISSYLKQNVKQNIIDLAMILLYFFVSLLPQTAAQQRFI